MKRTFILAAATLLCLNMAAQENTTEAPKQKAGFEFTTIKALPITKIQNQNNSGTCWAFSSMAFFEAEMLRMGKPEVNLSEMYLVYKTMMDRATAAVRTHGDVSFSGGGSFYDAVYCYRNYGMMPEEAYGGIMYGDSLHNHSELSAVTEGYVTSIAKGKMSKLSPVWKQGLSSIYDAYLGKLPEKFSYKGKEYTPRSFADEVMGLNMDDYVSLTSYTHHPFYQPFILEIQDNWRWGSSYNLPLDEFMQVFDNAIDNGYPIAWGSDVSESGFSRNGVAIVPDPSQYAQERKAGSDQARWTGGVIGQRTNMYDGPGPELAITQELRQTGYDNWETTDDHGMLIYGKAKDQNGKEYFMVKNSWGDAGRYHGMWYASKAFVAYKTMNILVNKKALPKEILKKLGLK